MCTKEEVREVITKATLPIWVQILASLFSLVTVSIVGWLLINVHQNEVDFSDYKRFQTIEFSKRDDTFFKELTRQNQLDADREKVSLLAIAVLTGKVDILSANLNNLKEVTTKGTGDRYYGKDAKARELLVNELFKTSDHKHEMGQERQDRAEERANRSESRIQHVEDLINSYHNNNTRNIDSNKRDNKQ